MNTATILAGGAVTVATAATIPLGLAPILGRRNTRRDNADHAAVQAYTDHVSAALLTQVDDAKRASAAVGDDPDRLAHAAWRHAAAIHRHLDRTGQDTVHADRALDLIGDIIDGYVETSGTVCATPLANLIAADLLLHRLGHAFGRGTHARATTFAAAGALADAGFGVPNSRIMRHRLTEHDPLPLHHAHAAWLDLAYKAGILEAVVNPDAEPIVEPVFAGDVMVEATVPVYPPGHRLAHTNGMDTTAALAGNGGAR